MTQLKNKKMSFLKIGAWLSLCATCVGACAQGLQADWIDENNQRIASVRQTPVRIIVLDSQGQPQAQVPVEVTQLRRAFDVGFAVEPGGFESLDLEASVWRVFNAVSLESVVHWSVTQPKPQVRDDLVAAMWLVDQAQQRGMRVRWGGVISADPAKNPDWLVGLDGRLLEQMIDLHLAEVIEHFGLRVDQFDVYTDTLSHHFVESRLGQPMVRRLYEQAKALAPRAQMCMRFTDTLTSQRLPAMVQAVTLMRESFIPVDLIAIEQHITGKVSRTPMRRALEWIGRLDLGVVLVNLEVGGASAESAAVNLETLLRVVMADPNIQGIWMGAMKTSQVSDLSAALFDAKGNPTELGELFDRLWTQLWWTDVLLKTDELGNARTRVFAGVHQITAVLGDGQTVETSVWIEQNNEERIIVLRPVGPASTSE